MRIGHGRWRRRMSLLAMDALEGAERAAAEAHVRTCAGCAGELKALTGARRILDADPLLAPPPVSFETLDARVRARIADPEHRRRSVWPRLLVPLAAAAGVAVAVAALLRVPSPPGAGQSVAGPGAEHADASVEATAPAAEELLRRMERSLAREQAARYLSEAQDVLVTVAAGPPPCPEKKQTVEVGDEARRSRELLARRALLVEGREAVASAQPVLAEVEQVLREVAALPSCVRPGRLQALERQIERRRLLMKIDLMTRELQG